MIKDHPHTLLEWIQLPCKVENWEQVVKLLQLQHQVQPQKEPQESSDKSGEEKFKSKVSGRVGVEAEARSVPEVWGQ